MRIAELVALAVHRADHYPRLIWRQLQRPQSRQPLQVLRLGDGFVWHLWVRSGLRRRRALARQERHALELVLEVVQRVGEVAAFGGGVK